MQLGHQILRTLEALTQGPFRRFAAPRRGKKFRTHFGQIIGKNVVGSFALIAVQNLNGKLRQFHVWIELCNHRVVPRFDFPQKNVSKHRSRELEFALHVRQLVDDHNTDQDSWQFKNRAACRAQQSLRNRRIPAARFLNCQLS